MTGEIKIYDKDGKLIAQITQEQMPLRFSESTITGLKYFNLRYTHVRDDAGSKQMDKIKGIVLNTR